MKTSKIILSLLLGTWTAALPLGAEAREYEHIYRREDVIKCRNQDRNTVLGVGVGAVGGGVLGSAIDSWKFGWGTAIGAVAGGVVGGLIGNGVSCEEERTYIDNVEGHLGRGDYYQPTRRKDLCLTVIRSGRARNN